MYSSDTTKYLIHLHLEAGAVIDLVVHRYVGGGIGVRNRQTTVCYTRRRGCASKRHAPKTGEGRVIYLSDRRGSCESHAA